MGIEKIEALADIDGVIADAEKPPSTGGALPYSYASSMYAECVRRMTTAGSMYRTMVDRALAEPKPHSTHEALFGIVRGLRSDVAGDRLKSFEELVHSALFTDFLGGAGHLLEEGWPLPAAVVAGATLEEHLRQLAGRRGVPTTKGSGKPKEASALNDELYSQHKAYTAAHHSLVLGWIQIRNEAAHGKPEFANRTQAEIQQMIAGIREFIAKYPA